MVMISKDDLRSEAAARRDALTAAERNDRSARIRTHVAGILTATPPLLLAGFAAIRSEADIMPLLESERAAGMRVALPAMSGGGIVFRLWREGDELIPGTFGIREPGPNAPGATPDTVLVPMLGFDRAGHRVGYGKGHYDRALAALRQAGFVPRLIGIAFATQEVAAIPAEPYDVALDMIVTEDGVLRFAS